MYAFLNRAVRRDPDYRGLFAPDEYRRVEAFYAAHPELLPTPLHAPGHLATTIGVGRILIKDETHRFGLEAFKIAGARYAIETLGPESLTAGIVCATAGNHGRASAHAAHEIGVPCTVFLPAVHPLATAWERQTREARVAGMRRDGADVIDVEGSYEEAVAQAANQARQSGATIVSDTSWAGYDAIPRLIMAGYSRLFDEACGQWDAPPDVVLVQGGVGGLVCAAANWFAARFGSRRPFLIACEPESAACLLESARAGEMVNLDTHSARSRGEISGAPPPIQSPEPPSPEPPSLHLRQGYGGQAELPAGFTFMAGLRCAEPSPAAWPSIQFGIDAFVAIPDSIVIEAMDRLKHAGGGDPCIAAGPSGACGAGALLALARDPALQIIRNACSLDRSTSVMVVVTEGP